MRAHQDIMKTGRFLYLIWRVLRWLLLALVLLVLGLIATVWWANRADDPLLPQVEQAMRFEPPSPAAMRDNGYFTLLALGAPPSEDALAAGQRFFAAQMQGYEHYRRTGENKSFTGSAFPRHNIDMSPMRCGPEVDDCYARYLQHAQAIRSKLSGQAALIGRYLSLRDKPAYEEVIPPDFAGDLANYQDATAASELIVMRAALLLDDQHTDEALALLEANARIHRQMMDGSRSLIGAMIALAMDVRQQRLLSSALRHVPALAASHAQRLDALVQSTTPMRLTDALEGELKGRLSFAPRSITSDSWTVNMNPMGFVRDRRRWGDWFRDRALAMQYLPNATLNSTYLDMQGVIHLSRLPPDQLAAARPMPVDYGDSSRPLIFPLRNAIGHHLLAVAAPDYMVYIERAHDIEGYQRLIRLQIAALHEHVPFDQLPAWLAQQPPGLRNPYTLQPMGQDAATQSLVFEGRQKQTQNPEPRNVYRVQLGTATAP
jgi:hypothetical protein